MLTLNQIHENDDFITQTRLRHALYGNQKTRYLKKEYVFVGGAWAGDDVAPLWRRTDRGKNLVLAESDYEFNLVEFSRMLMVGGYDAVWSTHLAAKHVPRRVHSLPLGLPYDSDYPFPFDVIGDTSILREAYASTDLPDISNVAVFGAFADSTHPERARVRSQIEKSPIGRWESYTSVDRDSHRAYLSAMRECGLVACPRGVGIDTYRFWEAIYMGAVPIIKKPPKPLAEAIFGLPFIVLSSWHEVSNVAFLQERWAEKSRNKIDYVRASLSHLLMTLG